jgi:hypothetical protein
LLVVIGAFAVSNRTVILPIGVSMTTSTVSWVCSLTRCVSVAIRSSMLDNRDSIGQIETACPVCCGLLRI